MEYKCKECGATMSIDSNFINKKCFKCGSPKLSTGTVIFHNQAPHVVPAPKQKVVRKKKNVS